MLCEMEKRTEWHIETRDFVMAEKLGGGPFIVSKWHERGLSDERRDRAERLTALLFDDFELVVRMNLVPDHWHAHIVTDEAVDLSDESATTTGVEGTALPRTIRHSIGRLPSASVKLTLRKNGRIRLSTGGSN